MTAELAGDIVNGAYWLREPGPNAEVLIAYQGAVAPEAIAAVGLVAEDRRASASSLSPLPIASMLDGRPPNARASAAIGAR